MPVQLEWPLNTDLNLFTQIYLILRADENAATAYIQRAANPHDVVSCQVCGSGPLAQLENVFLAGARSRFRDTKLPVIDLEEHRNRHDLEQIRQVT